MGNQGFFIGPQKWWAEKNLRSLRFNSGDSAYLSRTPATAGNRKTWTWAGWVKRSSLTAGDFQTLFCAGDAGIFNRTVLRFNYNSDDCLITTFNDEVGTWNLYTTAVFRDVSAWYHIVLAVDTTQSTAADRVKLYVNGVAQTLSGTQATLDELTNINNNKLHYLGNDTKVSTFLYDGYLTDVHFVDGQALAPTAFGEFDDNGIWQPREYLGDYGTNGFRLNFGDNTSTSTLGLDSSGKGNNWTANNLSVIQGTGNYNGSTSGSLYSGSWINAFNGDVTVGSGKPYNYNTTSTLTFPTALSGIIEVYGSNGSGSATGGTAYIALSDGSQWSVANITTPNAQWYSFGSKSNITSISLVSDGSSQGTLLGAIRVDGIVLIDNKFAAGNDSLLDHPVHYGVDKGVGGEVRGNYCTWNPLDKGPNATLSNGNLNSANSAAVNDLVKATIGMSSGKWYAEFQVTSQSSSNGTPRVGLSGASAPIANNNFGSAANEYAFSLTSSSTYYGRVFNNNVWYGTATAVANNSIAMVAFDADTGKMWFGVDGIWFNSGNPNAGTNSWFTATMNEPYFFTVHNVLTSVVANFGQRAFAYQAPSGFKALCTQNLSTPTIEDSSAYMDVALYTGNSGTQSITGLGFSPDFLWFKSRSVGYGHRVFDQVRGFDGLYPNETVAEDTNAVNENLVSYDSNGFTVGTTTGINGINNNNVTMAAWAWDAGQPDTASTGAVRFDGSGDYLSLASNSDFAFGTGDFTVEAYVYKTGTANATYTVYDLGAVNSSGSFGFYVNYTTLYVRIGGLGNDLTVSNFPSGRWVHIAASRSSSTLRVFVDGVLSASGTRSQDVTQSTPYIGYMNGFSGDFDGFISNLRVIKGTALYTSNFTPPSTELTNVTNTKLLCCQSTTSATAAAVSSGVITANGDAAATTHNPLDAFSVNGTGYSTASAAGLDGGSLTPTGASVNTKSGFSIIKYTGNLSSTGSETISHGLPNRSGGYMLITKSLNVTGADIGNWLIQHSGLTSASHTLRFDTSVESNKSGNGTMNAPDTSVFYTNYTVGSNVVGNNYIAYLWTEIPGFSKFGTYTGDTTNFPFVFTGFRPRWVLLKASTTGSSWTIEDAARSPYNQIDARLFADTNEFEYSNGNGAIDFTSNGFKIRTSHSGINTSAATYIYAAFAENPFRSARAR